MDTMRGDFGSLADGDDYDPSDDDARQAPPPAIGQDERRMQVRAYNHWASLLGERNFPAIEDLEPANLPDFGPYSVLLDFSSGIDNPGISFLGADLAGECGADQAELRSLADVPSRSLLTRITDHYMQILANQAPIGFEAEFVNQRGATIAYRGILLPFSSDDDTIDFIFGVINWKELADARAADELLLEIDQALEPKTGAVLDAPLTDWADGPGSASASLEPDAQLAPAADPASGYALGHFASSLGPVSGPGSLPLPSFGLDHGHDNEAYRFDDDSLHDLADEADDLDDVHDGDDEEEQTRGPAFGSLLKMPIAYTGAAEKAPLDLGEPVDGPPFDIDAYDRAVLGSDGIDGPVSGPAIVLPEIDPADMELGDWLAAAREMAATAHSSEDRTRSALYEAIGRAYDFSLAAAQAPQEFDELLADGGLTKQDRAPMTPVVKLVFGADYDKTRLTEYAAALSHAHRLALPQGSLGSFLGQAEGGLKGVVKAERRLRREEAGKSVDPLDGPRQALARKLRALVPQDLLAIPPEGSEFALVMIRRTEAGEVVLLGEVPEDLPLIERAARRLTG